jgi:hypothetical protein
MITPEAFWMAVLGAVAVGLLYHRLIVLPQQAEAKMDDAVRAFGRAVELRFPNHAGLTEVVARLARRVGKALGLGPRRLHGLERSIRLRDIGLCAIPYRLVNRRAWEEWTMSEMATYECHAEVGGAILESIPALAEHAQTVRMHHANFRLHRDEADLRSPGLEARIAKGCVEYVWYARHRGVDDSLDHVRRGAGTLFDPAVSHEIMRIAGGDLAGR